MYNSQPYNSNPGQIINPNVTQIYPVNMNQSTIVQPVGQTVMSQTVMSQSVMSQSVVAEAVVVRQSTNPENTHEEISRSTNLDKHVDQPKMDDPLIQKQTEQFNYEMQESNGNVESFYKFIED